MVGRKNDWLRIKMTLIAQLSAESCGFMVLFGDYGMGKSFTLRKLEDALRSERSSFLPRDLRVLVVRLPSTEPQLPRNFMVDLYTRIIRGLGGDTISSIAKIGKDASQLDSSLQNALARLDDGGWDWLIGRKQSTKQMQQIGVKYRATDYAEIHGLFLETLKLFRLAEYGALVILLDEWEYLLSIMGRTKILGAIHELQRIWDDYNQLRKKSDYAKVIFVIASSGDAWRRFIAMADQELKRKGGGGTETFLRRIPPDASIDLAPLERDGVEDLIKERLRAYAARPRHEDSVEPFTDDYVELIRRYSFGIPSKILTFSALVLKEAAENQVKKVDARLADDVLKQYNVLLEMEEVK